MSFQTKLEKTEAESIYRHVSQILLHMRIFQEAWKHLSMPGLYLILNQNVWGRRQISKFLKDSPGDYNLLQSMRNLAHALTFWRETEGQVVGGLVKKNDGNHLFIRKRGLLMTHTNPNTRTHWIVFVFLTSDFHQGSLTVDFCYCDALDFLLLFQYINILSTQITELCMAIEK